MFDFTNLGLSKFSQLLFKLFFFSSENTLFMAYDICCTFQYISICLLHVKKKTLLVLRGCSKVKQFDLSKFPLAYIYNYLLGSDDKICNVILLLYKAV